MTYPTYPTFSPHTVLDWGSYERPEAQLHAVVAAPVPFLDKLLKARGGWIRWVQVLDWPPLTSTSPPFLSAVDGQVFGRHSGYPSGPQHLHSRGPCRGGPLLLSSGGRHAQIPDALSLVCSRSLHVCWRQVISKRQQRTVGAGRNGSRGRVVGAGARRPLVSDEPEGVQNFRDHNVNLTVHACDGSLPAPTSSEEWWKHHYTGHKLPHHHRFW